ncbi:VOC family protein [Reinekea blandensis]|uniref:Glyoxylase I family protein n=1 Tax=Reinekea blandensis MED297 TaxID=314283 RepID=A4BFI1_9GAMM|nr:VOC family protein [Reinekea blandensis]EAR09076.1 glyoxylase I family protein [Reinekea sp. MED297] [Reinekea blandensis MED297]
MALPGLTGVDHIAVIASDYRRSKQFYIDVLGGQIIAETYREARDSYKLDLAYPGFQIELFNFPAPPPRPSRPEAQGLRHLAFQVANLDESIDYLEGLGVPVEPVRVDELTGQRFTFFQDPDGLPLELVETKPANKHEGDR